MQITRKLAKYICHHEKTKNSFYNGMKYSTQAGKEKSKEICELVMGFFMGTSLGTGIGIALGDEILAKIDDLNEMQKQACQRLGQIYQTFKKERSD